MSSFSEMKVVLNWINRDRTILLTKDKSKSNTASNYRPITYLPLMLEQLTRIHSETIYDHLDSHNLLSEVQKNERTKLEYQVI